MTTGGNVLILLGAALLSGGVSYFVGRAAARCEVAGSGVAPVAPVTTRAEGIARPLPPASADIAELKSWAENEEIRRRWMFVSDEALLARFGVPKSALSVNHPGEETWEYPSGSDEISLVFTRGRLTAVYVTRGREKDE